MAERIHAEGAGIEQGGIKILLAGLLLLGTTMMIDGEKDGPFLLAARAQVNGRLAALTADLQARVVPVVPPDLNRILPTMVRHINFVGRFDLDFGRKPPFELRQVIG